MTPTDQLPKDLNGKPRSFTESELLPCPFCGGKAVYGQQAGRCTCIVYCEECGCALESNEQPWTNGLSWNTRKKQEQQP